MLFAQKAPEGGFLSAKPPWGAPAALSEPFGAIGWAGVKLQPGLRHPEGFRLANASEAQVLHELELRADRKRMNWIAKAPTSV